MGMAQHDRLGKEIEVEQRARGEFQIVWTRIAALPGDQRAAIVLRDVQGLSYQEVADVQQVELSTAKTRVHRARQRVVDLVGTEEDA